LHFKSSEFEAYQDVDTISEPWRLALEKELTAYVKVHYKNAACSVFGSSDQGFVSLVACTEASKFQPANFWYANKLLVYWLF
jgi:capping protein alpha